MRPTLVLIVALGFVAILVGSELAVDAWGRRDILGCPAAPVGTVLWEHCNQIDDTAIGGTALAIFGAIFSLIGLVAMGRSRDGRPGEVPHPGLPRNGVAYDGAQQPFPPSQERAASPFAVPKQGAPFVAVPAFCSRCGSMLKGQFCGTCGNRNW